MGLGLLRKTGSLYCRTKMIEVAITESSKAAIMRYLIESDGKTSALLTIKLFLII